MKFFAILLFSLLVFSLAAPVFTQDASAAPSATQAEYEACVKSAKNAFERGRCNLNKIGGITGFGKTQPATEAGNQTFYTKFAQIVNIVIGLTGIVAAVYLIYSGIKWMRAGGNETMITEAKEGIRNAVIGLVVIFVSYILVNFVVTQLIAVIGAKT